MIHQNLTFGNLITSNQLERLVKQQKILLKSPQDRNEKKMKPKRLFRSTSFKTEQHALLLLTPKKQLSKSPMLLKPPIEKNALKRLPSKPNPFETLGKSEKSISSTQRRSSAPIPKITRSEKQRHLNNKAPKTIVKQHHYNIEKAKKKKFNRLRMQYKFISRLQKNKIKKLRSKTLPLPILIRMTHTRAKTMPDEQHHGPILNLDDSLKRKIALLIMLRKSARRRNTIKIYLFINTCFQIPKKSVLVSKEKLINYQKQISEYIVKTQQEPENQVEFSPALDQIRAYQRRVNFTDRKQSLKINQKKKKSLVSDMLKKQSNSILELKYKLFRFSTNILYNLQLIPNYQLEYKKQNKIKTHIGIYFQFKFRKQFCCIIYNYIKLLQRSLNLYINNIDNNNGYIRTCCCNLC